MENQVTIQKETVLEAYRQASEEQKKVLENLFGKDILLPKDITERIKTFEDACDVLGDDNQSVVDYLNLCDATCSKDIIAFAKLRVIAEALNEGWNPMLYNKRYYPWFFIYNNEEYEKLNENEKKELCVVRRSSDGSYTCGGVVYADAAADFSSTYSNTGFRLAFKTLKLAEYCGRQFVDIWADYLFS